MIKVNLVGAGRKKSGKAGMKIALPASVTPVLLLLIILGTAGGGYWWWSSLAAETADLDTKKKQAETQKDALDKVIKADQAYEGRKKTLEQRVKIIESLQKNQVSPVIVLDQLAEAVSRTEYVWLSNLDQKDAVINMAGIGTSITAVADFQTNLQATRYFKILDVGPTTQSAGLWTFSLKCEFSPPRNPPPAPGGN